MKSALESRSATIGIQMSVGVGSFGEIPEEECNSVLRAMACECCWVFCRCYGGP